MASANTKLKKNYKQGGTILLFVAGFILMAYMMPRERKFTHEFYKGRPWVHDAYTAPFKFPIYKTNDIIKAEQDSVLKDIRPYFNYDAYSFTNQLNKFRGGFDSTWIEYSLREFQISDKEQYLQSNKFSNLRTIQSNYFQLIYLLLDNLYIKGILEQPDTVLLDFVNASEIIVVRGNIAEVVSVADLFTPKSAYEYVVSKINNELKQSSQPQINRYKAFFDNFNIDRFISPNVFYNAEASERERSSRLESVSLTHGMVQEGELIISKGEIVTQEKFQVLQSLKVEFEKEQGNVGYRFVRFGKLILLFVSLLLIYLFLYNFRREVLYDFVKTAFILFLVALMISIASITAHFDQISFYIIPFAILPILLRTFYDDRVAVFVHVITILVIGFIAPNSYEFVFLNIMAGIVAIFSLTNQYRRSRFFLSALFVVLTYSLTYFGISVVQGGSFSQFDMKNFGFFGINGVLILISFLLIYIFEKAFGLLSDTSLIELSDTNQPLLRKLAEVAPGTFQHSLQVANLAEEAIYRIGGNPLLIRAGALYHDIGKMYNPIYFIENQASGINPHDNLNFGESAKAIIDHVSKGVSLAKKNNLPKPLIDFITTHHGTSTVQYFYRSYIKKYPSQEVDMKQFSYPGPKPTTKEMAVLMMADSVEAASRSLTDYFEETISELVESIIDSQVKDGQFAEAAITFRELNTVKEVFKTRLKNIYHARISYPR
jgi:putative nucleotidyltransferase with HDIG domain